MRNTIVAAIAAVLAVLVVAGVHDLAAQGRQRITGEGFISEGVPKMPDPPGPAPRRDLSGAWVGPQNNKPDPIPPMTPAGQAQFTLRKPYGPATGFGAPGAAPESNDPFITCDPLGFPRNLLAQAITSRGGMLFGSAPNRILIVHEQQRVWREIFMDGRALPKAVDVRGAPESRYYGYSVGHWENDNTLHAPRSVQPAADRHGGRSEVLHEAVDLDAGELLLDEGAGVLRVALPPVGGDPVSRHAGQAVGNRRAVAAWLVVVSVGAGLKTRPYIAQPTRP